MQSREKADCSVLAAQFALDLSYSAAYTLLDNVGRKPRQGVYGLVFEKLGLEQRPDLSCMTVMRALESMQAGRFVVLISGHFFSVVDGRIFDDCFTNPDARVQMVYQVPLDDAYFLARYPNLHHMVQREALPDVWSKHCENYAAQQGN